MRDLSSEALPGGFNGAGSITGVNIFNPQYTNLPFGAEPALTGFPTRINIGTKSVYLIDTANYNDFIILNGGIRYDDYGINASGYGTVNGRANTFGAQSQDSGLTEFQPRRGGEAAARSAASMPPMRRRRTRSAPNSTARLPSTAGSRRS